MQCSGGVVALVGTPDRYRELVGLDMGSREGLTELASAVDGVLGEAMARFANK